LNACAKIVGREYSNGTVVLDVWIGRNRIGDLQRLVPKAIEPLSET
jgi:hypothetical protein